MNQSELESVYLKNEVWYLRVKNAAGKWLAVRSDARNKAQAKEHAIELARKYQRQAQGLEAIPAPDGGGTVAAMMERWLAEDSATTEAHASNTSAVRRHLLVGSLAGMKLSELTPGAIERFMRGKQEELAPQTLNHLRGFLLRALTSEIRNGRWAGPNVVRAVKPLKVPRRVPDYLRWEAVPAVLAALDDRWRPLFATAIYTGMRKGELLGLRKKDVDFGAMQIRITRSYAKDRPKGGDEGIVPIATDLVPFLRAAISASSSDLVFPGSSGRMHRTDVKLVDVFRRALGRAGIVEGYLHKCRKHGCGHQELFADNDKRRCPTHGVLLWPVPQVRPTRFHDTRHSTASLLIMAGANTASVQKILRHSDPRVTMQVYAHLSPGYLRSEIDRLKFGSATSSAPADTHASGVPFVTRLLPKGGPEKHEAPFPRISPAILGA